MDPLSSDPLSASLHADDDDDEGVDPISSSTRYESEAERERDAGFAAFEARERTPSTLLNDVDVAVGGDDGFGAHAFSSSSAAEAVMDAAEGADEDASAASDNPHFPRKAKACCSLDRVLATLAPSVFNPPFNSGPIMDQPKPAIVIDETQKMSDMGTSSYVAYITRVDLPEHQVQLESRHRYSDFEAFHRLLRRMHPTIIVPPIPDKHNIADYVSTGSLAAMGGGSAKPKDDPKMIESRKRQLQCFLNRVAAHPILGREHVFHGFLDPQGRSWAEVLASSGVAHFLKVKDAKKQVGIKISDSLLKNPDPHFLASEEYTYKFGQQLSLMVKYHKRMIKHLNDSAATGTDLGAAYNGWSLTEQGPSSVLAPQIEALGEAIDCTVTSTHKLIHALEEHVSEPLMQYEKLTAAIEKTLKWRHALHVDYENATEGLVANRTNLQRLETTEAEAQRITARLRAEINGTAGVGAGLHEQSTSHYASIVDGSSSSSSSAAPSQAVEEAADDESDPYAETRRALANYHSKSTRQSSTTSSSLTGSGIMGAATKAVFPPSSASILASFNSLITADKDPETTRRSNIQRTREKIRGLETERVTHLSKLGAANEAIQRDLDRFQRDKIHDFRNLFLLYAVANRDHAKRCLGAWKEAQADIEGREAATLTVAGRAGDDLREDSGW